MPRIAIMQPYIFPYIGYFQLISSVDVFVFYNDVNFIKKGWINRNRILYNGDEYLFTIPCSKISQNRKICETRIAFNDKDRRTLIETVRVSYCKAPYFEAIFPVFEKIILSEVEFIDMLAMASVREVCRLLGMTTHFKESKIDYKNDGLVREERLIDICQVENVSCYINPIGGIEIYTKDMFKDKGIDIYFLKSNPIYYSQFKNKFIPWLSIIDVLMFNEIEKVRGYLQNYELI